MTPNHNSNCYRSVTDVLGLCLEKLPPLTSRYKQAEREELIIQCFERSGDLSLLQLQERQERGAKATTAVAIQSTGMWNIMDSDTVGVGPIVETAIQRSPILYIRNGYDLFRKPLDFKCSYFCVFLYFCIVISALPRYFMRLTIWFLFIYYLYVHNCLFSSCCFVILLKQYLFIYGVVHVLSSLCTLFIG